MSENETSRNYTESRLFTLLTNCGYQPLAVSRIIAEAYNTGSSRFTDAADHAFDITYLDGLEFVVKARVKKIQPTI